MTFSLTLKESIADLNLLKHPFYQDWQDGKLKLDNLQEYAKSYYQHVTAFPRYISATHAKCENLSDRKVLLENLVDEEGLNGTDHPELWLRFAEGLGLSRAVIEEADSCASIKRVIDTFFANAHSSYCEGLSSLYAYEYQVPEIAETKIEGLRSHYDIHDERSLSFFEVHKKADEYHRRACEDLFDKFDSREQLLAKQSARKSAQALWDFLTDIHVA